VRGKNKSDYPKSVRNNDEAKAYYGVFKKELGLDIENQEELYAEIALKAFELIEKNKIRDWIINKDIKNKMAIDLEDMLYDLKDELNLSLTNEKLEEIIDILIMIAMRRDS